MLLRRLHAPTCASNMIVVVAWIVQVHGRAGWNPIDAIAPVSGSWVERSGVRGYPSLQAGLEGTVLTLWEGLAGKGYAFIVRDLQQCALASTTARAIQQSGWCPRCDGGTYVVSLIPNVSAAYVAQYGPPPRPVAELPPQQMDALIYSIWGHGTAGVQAECIANHESSDDPNDVNQSSGATGLFQLMPSWWNGNNRLGWNFDPFDPRENALAAHLIWQQDGWLPWKTMHFCA